MSTYNNSDFVDRVTKRLEQLHQEMAPVEEAAANPQTYTGPDAPLRSMMDVVRGLNAVQTANYKAFIDVITILVEEIDRINRHLASS